MEVGLVIGVVACGTAACPAPTADLGQPVFVGKYQSQGAIGNTLNSFQNISVTIPTGISGPASIQVQRVALLTPPVSQFANFSGLVTDLLRKGTFQA